MPPVTSAIKRLLGFSVFWILLTEASLSSWIVGFVVITTATWLSFSLYPEHKSCSASIKLYRIPQFALYFAYQSILGGLVTAKLALGPKNQMIPRFTEVRVRLPAQSMRIVFSQVVGLLPGTSSVDLSENHLLVHTLNQTPEQTATQLQQCEDQIAKLYGIPSVSKYREH